MIRRVAGLIAGWLGVFAPLLAADAATGLGQPVSPASTAAAATAGNPGAASQAPPALGGFLDAQGRLALPAGFRGSLDPSGFALVSKPGEPPRFAAKNPIDDAARWDPQFGQAIGCDGSVDAMAAFPDGRVVLGGSFTYCGNVLVNHIAIWNPSTGVFEALGDGPAKGVNNFVFAVAVGGDVVYAAGQFSQAGGAVAPRLARFDTVTRAWAPLGASITGLPRAIAVSAGVVYVGGSLTAVAGGTLPVNNVARFDIASQAWSALGSGAANGVNGSVAAIAVSGGDVFVGGTFSAAGGNAASNVARFSTASQSWFPLGAPASNGVDGGVRALAVAGSRVFVGGSFDFTGGGGANRVAQFNTVTQAWNSLGSGVRDGVRSTLGIAEVRALAVSGSTVYLGGAFTEAGGEPAGNVARFDTASTTWTSLGTGAANGASADVQALAVASSDVYAGGAFAQAGAVAVSGVARFRSVARTWAPLGTGASNGIPLPVRALAVAGDDVIVGGEFTRVGGITANHVARFNTATQSWSSLGSGTANGVGGGALPGVRALAVAGSDIYVGGSFTQAGGSAANRVARFSTTTQAWSSLGSGAANGVGNTVNALAIVGTDVYVGGGFTQAGGAAAGYIARFRTSTQAWSTLGAGPANGVDAPVNAIAVGGNLVFLGGLFTQAGGAPANRLARFNTVTEILAPLFAGSIPGGGVGGGVDAEVRALATEGPVLYLGGVFSQAGGVPASNIARFNTATSAWSALGSGAQNGAGGSVSGIALVNGDVYAGGFFVEAGGVAANRIARFDATAQTWSALGGGAANGLGDGPISVLSAIALAGSDLYMGGEFTRSGPQLGFRIARYDARRATAVAIAAPGGPTARVNTQVTFEATVEAPGYPAQPGAVAFLDGGAVIEGCAGQPLVGGLDVRRATCRTATLAVGTHAFAARYQGDAQNFIGTSDGLAIEVLPPNFVHGLTTLPDATFNAPGYASGTISVSTAAATGVISPVAFQVVDAALLPPGLVAAPQPNGLSIAGTPTQAGSYTFTVRATDDSSAAVGGPFSGDRQYTIVVARATQAITPITRVDAQSLDGGVALADGVFGVQSGASSGLVVAIDSTTPTVCAIEAPGVTVRPLQIGTCTLRARQPGNTNYLPAADVLRTFQVKATPDVFVDSKPNASLFPLGAPQPDVVLLTATVETAAGASPTGSVRFQRAGNTLPGCAAQPLSGAGGAATATCSTTSLARGPNAITAQYGGDALNVVATSNVHTHQLNVGTATGIATVTPTPCVAGQPCTVAVAVAAASGVPTGSVQVGASVGGSCTVTLAAGGGTCALTANTTGAGTLTATYLGSPPWLASPAATQGHPFVATVDELFSNGFEPLPGTLP